MQKNILCLTSWLPAGDDDPRGSFIQDSIHALKEQGVNVLTVFTPTWHPGSSIQHYKSHDVKVARYFSFPRHYFRYLSNWSYLLRVSSKIRHLVKKHNIHLIHAHAEICGLAAVRVGTVLNIPSVVTLHGVDTSPRMCSGKAKQMFDAMLSNASRVVLVGESLQNSFKGRVSDTEHFRVVHNGFRLFPDMQPLIKAPWQDRLNLISVSNLQQGKGVDITIRALATLKQQGVTNWHYTIIGDGTERNKLESLVQQLDLTSQVAFLGFCSRSVVCNALKCNDIFCLPSYREAFGVAYVEAMAYGLLAIGVRGEGPSAYIAHNKTGLLVEPRSKDSLVSVLRGIFQQQSVMQGIAQAGREHVLSHFTWARHAKKLMQIYQEII